MAKRLNPILEFREDHRKVRDGVLEIARALEKKDVKKARAILGKINTFVGPHFRYEEEHLYPALKRFLGEYVDDLVKEHDGIIATARGCARLLSKDVLNKKEAEDARKKALAFLIHVSNCDGLAILSERFSKKELSRLGDKLARSRKQGVTLLDWAAKIRKNQR